MGRGEAGGGEGEGEKNFRGLQLRGLGCSGIVCVSLPLIRPDRADGGFHVRELCPK